MMEKGITVDKSRCIHCGMCIKDCFMSCISFNEEKIPQYSDGEGRMCLSCQHCMAVCPKGALSLGGVNPDDLPEVSYGHAEDLLNLIRSRRSVRKYKQQDVPQEKLELIRQMLAYPPTGANLPDLHVSIVGTKEKMDRIRKATYENVMKSDPSSILYQFSKDSYLHGEDMIYRGAPSMVVVAVNKKMLAAEACETVDPIISMTYLELYAQSLGLGTLWDDAALKAIQDYPEVRDLLEIPDDFTVSFAMTLGIPAVKYKRVVSKDPSSVKIV